MTATSTRVICWNGEQHNLMNHIIRKQGVINFHRSGQAIVSHRFELPSGMACCKISELIDAVRAYVAEQPQDYLALLNVQIDVLSAHNRNEDGLICIAKSNLFLFVHAYLQAAGVEYTRAPYPPIRVAADVHATLGRALSVGPLASPSSDRSAPAFFTLRLTVSDLAFAARLGHAGAVEKLASISSRRELVSSCCLGCCATHELKKCKAAQTVLPRVA
ncbi:hypothetical protein T492DRAFT_863039 [Pavlovales sp. CCMP2436]|nr:hypothetical protein T492DRAFT_863039 [Pavlovales sp. CCMP2436]